MARYRQDSATGKLVLIDPSITVARHHFIQEDLKDFVSSVDGSIIGSHRDMRNHNRRNDVVTMEEFGNQAALARAEINKRTQGPQAKAERIEALKHAVEVHKDNVFSTYQQYTDGHK